MGSGVEMRQIRVVVVAIAIVAAACNTDPSQPSGDGPPPATGERAETLILGFEGGTVASPDLANPFVPARYPMISAGLQQSVFESLFYLNYETGEMEPWQAESFEYSDDATQLTIKLREGVQWSDGEDFTADDVVFTVEMLKENETLIFGPDMKAWVESVEAVDDRTVRFTFTAPYTRFVLDFFSVQIFGGLVIMPEHIWRDEDPTTFKNFDLEEGLPVATGPYRMTEASSSEFVFERRDDWWAAETGFAELPAPKKLIFIEQGPEDRSSTQLAQGEVDGLPKLGLGSFKVAQAQNPNLIGWLSEEPYGWIDPCPIRFEFNTTVEPWDDPEMRHAVAYTIDTEKFADLTNEGAGIPARWLFPSYGPLDELVDANQDLFEKYGLNEFNLDKAAEIFESKGYEKGADGIWVGPDGEQLEIEVLMLTPSEGGVAWGIGTSLYSEFFEAAGISFKPRALATSVYQDSASQGDFVARQSHLCGSVSEPYKTLDAFHERRAVPIGKRADYDQSAGRWKNAEYSRIVDEIGGLEPGDPQIEPLFREALDIFLRELPAFGLYQQLRIVPYNETNWTNWPTEENNYIHPPNWWMTMHQILMEIQPAGG